MRRWLLLLWMATALTSAMASELREDPTEQLTRKIGKDLRCAVCQNQSVYDSNSDLAKDMLNIIREKVVAGENEAAIRDYFHQRYGDYIYLEPTRQGGNWLLWAGPFLGLLLGGWALWAALRRWRRQTPAAPRETTLPPSSAAERIKKEMDQIQW